MRIGGWPPRLWWRFWLGRFQGWIERREKALDVVIAERDGARAALDGATASLDTALSALRDFVVLLPPDRWHLLRPETQVTVDRLFEVRSDD